MYELIKSDEYNHDTIMKIEDKWRKIWYGENVFKTSDPTEREKNFYCLDMFPYPSGYGLHVGHPVGYVASDIMSRYKRMQGFNVLHCMGWDAFGLPTERYAMKTGMHPAETTRINAANFKKQMNLMGLSYDWSREFSTTDPEYYKWTQLIFLRLYNSFFDPEFQKARPIDELVIPDDVRSMGQKAVTKYTDDRRLVYYAESVVNWCPQLNTVVANEEVMNDGRTEHGYEVIRKPMQQVMMRITAYADRLLDGLDTLDWPESIKIQQRTWIGRTTGVEITFPGFSGDVDITVFTTRIDTIFGASFIVIAPELDIVDKITASEYKAEVDAYVRQAIADGELMRKQKSKKTGVFTGYYVRNPLTGEKTPVYVADYVLKDHGTGAIMGVAAHDTRDFEFAKIYGLEITPVFSPEDEGLRRQIINAEIPWIDDAPALPLQFDSFIEMDLAGKSTAEVAESVSDYIIGHEYGKRAVYYKMRDWVFSRQRYWGEPIPLVHMEDGTTISIPEEGLPLRLPVLDDYSPVGEGKSALARATDWLSCTDPATGLKGTREISTMPQWAGSCWYPLRFMDPHNENWLVDPDIEEAWGAVDLYIGGAEHATLHLLYARFWYLAMHDLGLIKTTEPFQKLLNQGMLTGFAYRTTRGILIPIDDVVSGEDGNYYLSPTSEFYNEETADVPLIKSRTKMSKSLRNVVNPDDVIAEYGADSFRMQLMFLAPVDSGREWETKNVAAAQKFLTRIWNFVTDNLDSGFRSVCAEADEFADVIHAVNTMIEGVSDDIERLKHNTAISKLMICMNTISKHEVSRTTLEQFVLVLSPFAPFMSEELWQRLGHDGTITNVPWPVQRNVKAEVVTTLSIVVTFGGKKIGKIECPAGADDVMIRDIVTETFAKTKWVVVSTDKLITVMDPNTQRIKLINVVRK
jgi:leucyl-tRNA synthetase